MVEANDRRKPSHFLRTLDPFDVYDAPELAMDYFTEVGKVPCWPIHSCQRAQIDIIARGGGIGCWMNTSKPNATVAYGYEVAECVAKQCDSTFKNEATPDLDDRFQAAVFALEAIGQ